MYAPVVSVPQRATFQGCSADRVPFTSLSTPGPAADPETPSSPTDGPDDGPTILIVDDEPHIRTLAARILKMSGYRVLLAADGKEAVGVFNAHAEQIVVVLLDATIPYRSATEVLQAIRLARPAVRVVLMSGYIVEELANRLGSQVLDGFLQKPFTPNDLRAKLREVLGDAVE